ncbi:GntR family transcriptional regulator [Faunimonas sp. B44]|uniref:GntR family transcriptional regulator n=1 Tax=Faunimonas sp. B44 TaxID=3461493 RepID=UPI00404489CE
MVDSPRETSPGPSLAEEAYRRIEDMIVVGDLPPGMMISENQLADDLKCGRTPVREALQRLKLEGYLEIHPRRGALVTPVDVRKQLELLEVRRSLEDLMVRLASERATRQERERMMELSLEILEAAKAAVMPRYFSANKEIHMLCAAATRNSMLIKTIGPVHGLSRRFWYAYIEDERRSEAATLHSRSLKAIAAGDQAAASEAAAALMDFLERLTRLAIERRL